MCYSPWPLLQFPSRKCFFFLFLTLKALFFCSLRSFLPFLSLSPGLASDETSSHLYMKTPNTYTFLNDAWLLAQSINDPIEFSHIPSFLSLSHSRRITNSQFYPAVGHYWHFLPLNHLIHAHIQTYT